ncbi:DNA mismatch repair endonuclease MutL [Criblamydia sequanensis]|uniref:DNA mismatch repair protein MutL n=1 Tax=Candidatus Criblamydia sequanensis CRIB-18 TaxID=1437425 RepID=A0A090D2M6_9BACT|nr:DNA mismatch repair endonuclease MutL [Criblamydia sequanensis]CDR34518.1 DNA mismatch repair protein MutL [Criblamydia sequanensis CRIB-18]
MTRVKILDDTTINQIAAGEVIENPASVVKELVENSIDAGASEIIVEIEGGGRDLIRVSDNGFGMNSEDAHLSLKRHATSKIRTIDDLFLTLTMGFRGEALPSIASISKFSLLTKTDGEPACFIRVEGGHLIHSAPSHRDRGTTIEVRDLFFNVPVRKKFQRSTSYDALDISRILTKLSLAHPSVNFELKNNHKLEFRTRLAKNGQEKDPLILLEERAKQVLKEEFIKNSLLFSYRNDDLSCFGLLGKPEDARSTKGSQYLIINSRPVYAVSLSECIKNAYGTLIEHQKHPSFLIHLNLPASYLDVNVHPQKREVRIRLLDKIKEELTRAFVSKLHGTKLEKEELNYFNKQERFEAEIENLKYEFKPSFLSHVHENRNSNQESYDCFQISSLSSDEAHLPKEDENFEFKFPIDQKLSILTLYPGFIVLEGVYKNGEKKEDKGITIVDQKSAIERLFYFAFENKKPLESQLFLIPPIFHLTNEECVLLEEISEELALLGMTFNKLGNNRFAMESFPSLLKETDLNDFLRKLLEEMGQGEKNTLNDKWTKKLTCETVKFSKINEKILTKPEALFIVSKCLEHSFNFSPSGDSIFFPLGSNETKTFFNLKK